MQFRNRINPASNPAVLLRGNRPLVALCFSLLTPLAACRQCKQMFTNLSSIVGDEGGAGEKPATPPSGWHRVQAVCQRPYGLGSDFHNARIALRESLP